MNFVAYSPVFIFLGLFVVYRVLFWPTLTRGFEYLITGPLKQLSANYFRELAKSQFESAARQNNPDTAWEEIVLAKIREMGQPKTPYEKRKENLEYLRNGTIKKKAVAGLIEVLPVQHRLSFQQELVCFICEKMNKTAGDNYADTPGFITKSLNAPIRAWNDIFSAWAASATLFFFIWNSLDTFPFLSLLSFCVVLFSFMAFPILRASLNPLSILAYFSFVGFSILITLASFAYGTHNGNGQQIVNLGRYGYAGINVIINYPKWLTADEIQVCSKLNKFSVLVEGGDIPVPMRFKYDNSTLSARNSKCVNFIPEANIATTTGQAFEFYLSPLDREFLKKQQTNILPIMILQNQPVNLDDYEISINIEQSHWGFIRQAVYFIYSGGALTFFTLLAQFAVSLRKKE